MFKLNSVGRKLYFSVLAVFLVFAVSFIVFQQAREKQYKIGTLTIKLENYNELLAEDLALSPGEGIILQDSLHDKNLTVAQEKLKAFVREHESKDLRVTLVRPNGKVIYDKMETIGEFETSNPVINQVYKNAYWGIRGNYRGMPTMLSVRK